MKKEFHHIGIPSATKHENEIYLEANGLYITDATANENRIEWLRFEAGSNLPELLKTTAHVAYAVDDLDAALAGRKVIAPPWEPLPGVRVAFIEDDGAPVEFLQFSNPA